MYLQNSHLKKAYIYKYMSHYHLPLCFRDRAKLIKKGNPIALGIKKVTT